MAFNVLRARHETPGCENVLHFNNAGAALMPKPVLDSIITHLQMEAEIGGYEAAERSHDAVNHIYDSVATLIGCHRDEIAIIENATRAWDMAFYSIPLRSGDRILTSMAEYGSNYIAFLQVARRTGATVEVIPNDEHGQISINALCNAIDDHVKLIAITHVPTNGGLVNPAVTVGKVAREAGILYLLDACQSIGQMPVDVNVIGCDFLSATGRKYLRGPRGTGFLYVRRDSMEQLEPPFLDIYAAQWVARDQYRLRPDARRFENWETNYATKIGLGVAIDYALNWSIEAIWSRIRTLATTLRAQLNTLRGVTVWDVGIEKCGIVSFTVDTKSAKEIRYTLAQQSINVSVSTINSTRLDMEARGLTELVRASVHYYNSEEEVERFCAALASVL
jgi:cysteine desulfurase / selenocysteine lyase